MNINFYKYHGAGNDFILIDNRKNFFDKNIITVERICNRRLGVGADGLILLENDDNYAFRMVYYNSDGKESTMCGNGGRCIVAFAKKLNIIKDKTRFIAIDGEHKAVIDDDFNVNLQMQNVEKIEVHNFDFVLDTGSPHYVKIVEDFSEGFVEKAKTIRNSKQFVKNGINVSFIKIINDNIKIRTFERGVENETLACGTACVASALILMKQNNFSKVFLNAKGGNLEVSAIKSENGFKNIWLFGPTKFVFMGKISL